MSQTTLDPIHNGCRDVRDSAENLMELAGALYFTGNIHLADQLATEAASLRRAERQIDGGVSAWINQDVSRADESYKSTVMAALAGIKLASVATPQ